MTDRDCLRRSGADKRFVSGLMSDVARGESCAALSDGRSG